MNIGALFCTKYAETNGFLSRRDPHGERLFADRPNPFNFKDASLIATAFPVRVRARVTSGSVRPWRRVRAAKLTWARFDPVLSPATSGVGVRACGRLTPATSSSRRPHRVKFRVYRWRCSGMYLGKIWIQARGRRATPSVTP